MREKCRAKSLALIQIFTDILSSNNCLMNESLIPYQFASQYRCTLCEVSVWKNILSLETSTTNLHTQKKIPLQIGSASWEFLFYGNTPPPDQKWFVVQINRPANRIIIALKESIRHPDHNWRDNSIKWMCLLPESYLFTNFEETSKTIPLKVFHDSVIVSILTMSTLHVPVYGQAIASMYEKQLNFRWQ